MSDRLFSVVQINGGGSKPAGTTLYPRELYITSDGYLYSGNPTESNADTKTTTTSLKVGTADTASSFKVYHPGTNDKYLETTTYGFRLLTHNDNAKGWGGSDDGTGHIHLHHLINKDEQEDGGDYNYQAILNGKIGNDYYLGVKFGKMYGEPGSERPVTYLSDSEFVSGKFTDVMNVETARLKADKQILSTKTYGTKLPTRNLENGQVFFLIEG